MRTIYFRGKSIKDGEWYVGNLETNAAGDRWISEMDCGEGNTGFFVNVDCETVGQFTGLIDKNAVLIFEGDIVKCGEFTYVIEWKNDIVGFGYKNTDDRMLDVDGANCEVIGNIHDNKERF